MDLQKKEFFTIKEGQRSFLARRGNLSCFVFHFAAVIVNDDGLPKLGMAVSAKLAEVGNLNFSEVSQLGEFLQSPQVQTITMAIIMFGTGTKKKVFVRPFATEHILIRV